MQHARKIAALAVALLALCRVSIAQAQSSSDSDAARSELIAHSVRARAEGHHAEALDLAQRAGLIRMSASLRRFVAEEQAANGQLGAALGTAELCVQDARVSGRTSDVPHHAACERLVASLEHRVARVIVRAPANAPAGLQIVVEGETLLPALWGVSRAVPAGVVTIEARLPNGTATRHELRTAAGSTTEWTVEIPPRVSASANASGGSGETSGASSSNQSNLSLRSDAARDDTARTGPGAAPWILVGVGAVGLVAGATLWFLAEGQLGSAIRACGGGPNDSIDVCTTANDAQYVAGMNEYGTAAAMAVSADVALAVGGVALVGGVVWLLVGRGPSRPSRVAVTSRPHSGGGFVMLSGQF
jgi:hypothetical protein